MSPLAIGHARQTNRSIPVTDPVARRYLGSLRSTDLHDVGVLELLQTLFEDVTATSAATASKTIDITDFATGLYRDAADTLVVRHHDTVSDRLSLLWPVSRRYTGLGDDFTVIGCRPNVFLANETTGTVLPLPAVSTERCVFGWGSAAAGTANLYLALVYAVQGAPAPVPHPRLVDHPDSLYGRLIRTGGSQLRMSWSAAVAAVEADEPLRRAFARVPAGTVGRPTRPAPSFGLVPSRVAGQVRRT